MISSIEANKNNKSLHTTGLCPFYRFFVWTLSSMHMSDESARPWEHYPTAPSWVTFDYITHVCLNIVRVIDRTLESVSYRVCQTSPAVSSSWGWLCRAVQGPSFSISVWLERSFSSWGTFLVIIYNSYISVDFWRKKKTGECAGYRISDLWPQHAFIFLAYREFVLR